MGDELSYLLYSKYVVQLLIRLCTSQNVLLTNSQPAALIDHSGAFESVDLLKRTLVVTDPEISESWIYVHHSR
jgi:hypothetical protein